MSQIVVEQAHIDWTHVVVDSNVVFNRKINEWLDTNVGESNVDWAWGYRWSKKTGAPDTIQWIDHCQLTVMFADSKFATLFTLRWSDICE